MGLHGAISGGFEIRLVMLMASIFSADGTAEEINLRSLVYLSPRWILMGDVKSKSMVTKKIAQEG
jgi:hypothetical protein